MLKSIFVIVLVTACITPSENANILGIFYYPSYSHQIVYQSLVKDLSERGHTLTILTADRMNSNHPNVTEIYMDSSYEENINFVDCKEVGGLKLLYLLLIAQVKRSDRQLSQPEVQDLIKNHTNYKFDLILLEYLFASPMVAFADLYDCPVVGISAIGAGIPVHELLGNPVNPAIHSEIIFPYQHGRLKFFERISSFIYYYGAKFLVQPMFEYIGMRQVYKYFENFTTDLAGVEDRVDLVFVNTNPVLDYSRPITPNTIQLGFMHVEPPKPVVGELKELLDSSQNGVIYMSLGSNVKSKDLREETITVLLNTFSQLSYDVLWKFEDDRLTNKSNNVKISKWFPQSDLLAHPNVKLFITQGGLMSMEESIDRETPMIAIPFLLDQNQNAMKIEEGGFGKRLLLEDITEARLHETIDEVLKQKYKDNIRKFKKLVYDEPMTSREKAVWWTEYVIRHKGAKHLKFPGRLVPFYQRYCLDVIATLAIAIYLSSKLFSTLSKTIFKARKTKMD